MQMGGATKIRAVHLELAPPVRLTFCLLQRPKLSVSFLKIEERDSHSGQFTLCLLLKIGFDFVKM